jgi:hypothetical protein
MTPKPAEFIDTFLAIAIVVLLFAIVLILAFQPIPEKNMTLFASLGSGVIGAGFGTLIGYRWSSSKGSAAKDDTIAAIAKKASE